MEVGRFDIVAYYDLSVCEYLNMTLKHISRMSLAVKVMKAAAMGKARTTV